MNISILSIDIFNLHFGKCINTVQQYLVLFFHQTIVFKFVLEEPVQGICTVVVLCLWRVVGLAVGQHPLHVRDEQPLVDVVVRLQTLRHGLQIHRELYVVIVVRNCLPVNGVQEWPGGLIYIKIHFFSHMLQKLPDDFCKKLKLFSEHCKVDQDQSFHHWSW